METSEGAQPSLGGRTVILLEARRAEELAGLVRRYGGEPWSVPALQEAPLDDASGSVAAVKRLCDEGADVVICLTGVGTRRLFELAGELGLEARLREVFDQAIVAIRGPKPRAVLRDLGVRIDRAAAEPNTSREVLAALAGDAFTRVAVQLYGEPDAALRQGLEARGASVLELPLYRWELPADTTPLLDAIDHLDRAQALCVTSASQVRNLFEVAEAAGKTAALRQGLAGLTLAAVGPVAARALEERGLTVAVQPEHPHMGPMVRELARKVRGYRLEVRG